MSKLERLYQGVERELGKLDGEAERDIAKIQVLERKLIESPLAYAQLRYVGDGNWTFRTFNDDTGKLKWSLTPTMVNDPVRFVGDPVFNGTRSFRPIACSIAKWGVYVAFKIEKGRGGKARKLFTKSDPRRNLVYLRCGEACFQAIAGELDQDPGNVGIVAFPLPQYAAEVMHIEFRLGESSPTITIECDGLADLVRKAAAGPSIADQMLAQMNKELDPVRNQAKQVRSDMEHAMNAQSGCFGILMIVGIGAVAWGLFG